jgi:hypothetical protein
MCNRNYFRRLSSDVHIRYEAWRCRCGILVVAVKERERELVG